MNARQEFVFHTAGKKIKCAIVQFGDDWSDDHDDDSITYTLPVNYTQEEYDVFLQSIDREYDVTYGPQELFGDIWYEDGSWSSREVDYDNGSEWWERHKCPLIPAVLNAK